MTRREFLRQVGFGAASAAALAVLPTALLEPIVKRRIGDDIEIDWTNRIISVKAHVEPFTVPELYEYLKEEWT